MSSPGEYRMTRKVWRVEIEWEDSQLHLGGWDSVASHAKRRRRGHTTCHSVGYVLADDERGIMLAASINGTNAAGVVCIPASQIRKRRRLR